MPRGDKHLHGGQRQGAGRPPAKAILRKGFRIAMCFDGSTSVWGEIYDIERMGDQKVIRWRSDDGTQTIVVFAPDA